MTTNANETTASPAPLPDYVIAPVKQSLDEMRFRLREANDTIQQYLNIEAGVNSKHLADWYLRQDVCAKAVCALEGVLK